MAGSGTKVIVNLKTSISTNTVNEDIYSFNDESAPLVSNNGIQQLGGITNINETELVFSQTGKHFYTDNGQLLESIDSSSDLQIIQADGLPIGQVSSYGVESRTEIKGFDDIALTADGTYITIKLNINVVTISEYSFANVLLHSRTVTFTNLTPLISFITSFGFVRYQPMHYSDSQEFSLRMGDQVVILQESVPGISLTATLNSTSVLGNVSANVVIVYNGFLVVAGAFGRVGSFDGLNWKNYDGTGTGSGPFFTSLLGGNNINRNCGVVYNGQLILGGAGGRLASLNVTNWFDYNATTGIVNNAVVIGANAIQALSVFSTFLIIGGVGGRVGSFDGTNFKNYDGTGTGTGAFNNAGVIGANNVDSSISFSTFLIIAGDGGRLGSWDGSNWKNYDGTGTGTGPNNNSTVIGGGGGVNILAMVVFSTFLVVAGSGAGTGGRLGSWDGSNWKNYDGTGTGTGPFNNATVLGGVNDIVTLCVFNSTICVSGISSRLGSWDGSNWKNYDGTGTGTGIFSAGLFPGGGGVICSCVYNGILVVGGGLSGGGVNSITTGRIQGVFYTEGVNFFSQLLIGFNSFDYLYVYRYENGLYLISLINNAQNKIWILNNSTFAVVSVKGIYAWPQVSSGKTRHIITETPRIATDLFSMSLIGYTDFSAFTSVQIYQSNGLSVSSIVRSQSGWNYADVVLKQTTSATNIFNYYGPVPIKSPSGLASVYQGNTDNLISGHGKLSNAFGVPSTLPFEFRTNWISANNTGGTQQYLSVALTDSQATDAVGVIITAIGEFFDGYQPQVVGDNTILYQFNGIFYIVKISKVLGTRIQRINDRLFKLNTLSPQNIYDSFTKKLEFGSLDYNGKMLFSSTSAPAATNTKVVSVIESTFSNAVDTGDRLIQIPTPASANIQVFGFRIPLTTQLFPGYHVDSYFNDAYSFSTFNDGSELILTDPANPIYASDTRLPVPIGATYGEMTVQNYGDTIFLDRSNNNEIANSGYDGYQIGNDAQGVFRAFLLFGQVYLFDGLKIFLANIQSGFLQNINEICDAEGMIFIASAPIEIYFLSNFDNSIYTFNGGRSLVKQKSFVSLDTITQGVFNVHDNSLLLDSTNNFIWMRDGIITQNAKKANQAGSLNLFTTQTGIFIANQLDSWRYSYNTTPTSTVVPLIFQIAYFGQEANQKSILKAFVVTIYNSSKGILNIKMTEKSKDQDSQNQAIHALQVKNGDYDSLGYAHLRIQPQYQSSLGSSLMVVINEKSVVLDVSIMTEDLGQAVIAKGKSL